MNHKQEAAKACLRFLKPGLVIGLGAGATIAYLVDFIREDAVLAASLTFVSSSFKTRAYLLQCGLNTKTAAMFNELDVYFDGCDQFDTALNAMKSGGGIHTNEKILASMAKQFILIGDESKYVPNLNNTYPLVIEIIADAQQVVFNHIEKYYPNATVKLRMSNNKDGAVISDNGHLLADVWFTQLPDIAELNTRVKMIPGVVDHSLFYQMAHLAVIAGDNGIRIITK